MKVLTIVGTQPQFIKAALVSRALMDRWIDEFMVQIGQHYDPGRSDGRSQELKIWVQMNPCAERSIHRNQWA